MDGSEENRKKHSRFKSNPALWLANRTRTDQKHGSSTLAGHCVSCSHSIEGRTKLKETSKKNVVRLPSSEVGHRTSQGGGGADQTLPESICTRERVVQPRTSRRVQRKPSPGYIIRLYGLPKQVANPSPYNYDMSTHHTLCV